jgi:hypothetical protein
VFILKDFKLFRINTCISADSKELRLHTNHAILEEFFVKNRGGGPDMGTPKKGATDIP